MATNNISLVTKYYMAMGQKDIMQMSDYLHPDVILISPFGITNGKEEVLQAAKQFCNVFDALTIRTSCGSDNDVMLAIDVHCPAPIGLLRTAVLVTLKNNLIISTELFHDTSSIKQDLDGISA